MSSNRLIYLPLGGAGEIGMNCYVYGYGPKDKERLIIVDIGVAFPDMDGTPGVDLILPDIAWLEERKTQIEAIFITHAHEDHVGAIGHLFERLGQPAVYARAFTSNIARGKLSEYGYSDKVVKTVSKWPATVEAGPFTVGFLPISHSIPESSSLVIDTPEGRVIHTGDFKIDHNPLVGEAFDPDLWADVAAGGVKALICDSTNVFNAHEGRSESTLGPAIVELIAAQKGLVVATTFASNVARVKTLADAGEAAGRSICLMGRAMRRMIEASIDTGVLTSFPKVVSPEDAMMMPRDNVMLIVTGSQGERRAASAQLANGKYQGVVLKEGDLFLFSSKTIPGNEKGVIRIINQFSEMGVDVVDDSNGKYHVSGHANRPDIEYMQKLVKPQIVIPMHGEHRHLREMVKIARGNRFQSILAPNGMMVNLSGNEPAVAGYVETGRTYLDGSAQVGALDGVVRDRIRMALNGHVTVTLILDDENEPLGEPWCEIMGLAQTGRSGAPLVDVLEADLDQFINRASEVTLADDDKLEQQLKKIVRQTALDEIGKKPEVTVVISRLSA
jgi:ribonuclease J